MNQRIAAGFLIATSVVVACSVNAQQHAQVAEDDAVPFGLLEPDTPPLVPSTTLAPTEQVEVCFVQGDALIAFPVALDPPVGLDGVVAALAEPPLGGDTPVRTAVTDPSIVREVELLAGIARVDLLPSVSSLGGSDQLLAIAQLVCTLTARPGVGQVSFTLDGAVVDVPRGDGSLTADPVSRDDYVALLA